MNEHIVRESLPTPVAAVAARQGSRIAVIVDDGLPESTADWAGDLAFSRMTASGALGVVLRDEVPANTPA
jgi:hypothetical protein